MSATSVNQASRTFAIGDIHGCDTALQTLLNRLDLQSTDRLIFLGDYIDRGPNSRAVVETLLDLQTRCRVDCLAGNHEWILMGVATGQFDIETWKTVGGDTTLASYGGGIQNIVLKHGHFFQSLQRWAETQDFLFVHASYDPLQPMDMQSDHDLFWKRSDPLTVGPHQSGKTVVCGHTPQVSGEVSDHGHLILLDTYCFGSGWLSALDVESMMVYQARNNGQTRRYRLRMPTG